MVVYSPADSREGPHVDVVMNIATYTRISTDEEHQPFSLEAQAERLDAYVRSQDGWQIAD
jgi:site-specific DNA recombinase